MTVNIVTKNSHGCSNDQQRKNEKKKKSKGLLILYLEKNKCNFTGSVPIVISSLSATSPLVVPIFDSMYNKMGQYAVVIVL